MAVFEHGIMGPFKGRVGNVVGYEWRGLWVMRSLPKNKQDRKPTEKQLANQARFNLMQDYLSLRKDFIRKGFSLVPELRKMSQFNVAMSYNLSHAIKGEYPNWEIDYSQVVFARGDLELPKDIAISQERGRVCVSWSTEIAKGATGGMSDDDQAMVMISGSDHINGKHSASLRSVGKDFVEIDHEPGTELFVHIAFISDDRQRVSDSKYLGSIIVE